MHKLFALILLTFGSSTASACSCPMQTVEGYVHDADTIYIATLLEATSIPRNTTHQWAQVEGKFRIDRVFKGKVSEQFATLVTGDAGASCGVFMVVPAKYVIFTGTDSDAISWCSGSKAISPFDEEELSKKIIAALALPARPKKPDEIAPQTAQ